ncbi:MAG: efflux RND transporter periplasmic adaptor subunit [Burkholderiaceae bacterium]
MKNKTARTRFLLWAVAAVVLIGSGIWAFMPQPVTVEANQVRLGVFEQDIREDGLIRVRNRYMVTSPVAGTVSRISLKVGDHLKLDDPIAVIRALPPTLHDARSRWGLQEAYRAAQAAQLRARAEVARARSAVQQASADYQRARELADQGFTAVSQADSARRLLAQQNQSLEAAQFAAQAASHQAEMARTAVLSGDQLPLDDAVDPGLAEIPIRAPVGGVVLKLLHESEGPVIPGTQLLEIGDTSQLEAVVDVLSVDATSLRAGMTVRLNAGSGISPLFGYVSRVEPVARTKVSTLGVEEQRVDVVVEFSHADQAQALGDGYQVEVTIVTRTQRDALLLPIGALIRDSDGWYAYVADDDKVRQHRVEVLARNAQHAWIGKGVEAGDWAIVYPPDSVKPGVSVRFGREDGRQTE